MAATKNDQPGKRAVSLVGLLPDGQAAEWWTGNLLITFAANQAATCSEKRGRHSPVDESARTPTFCLLWTESPPISIVGVEPTDT